MLAAGCWLAAPLIYLVDCSAPEEVHVKCTGSVSCDFCIRQLLMHSCCAGRTSHQCSATLHQPNQGDVTIISELAARTCRGGIRGGEMFLLPNLFCNRDMNMRYGYSVLNSKQRIARHLQLFICLNQYCSLITLFLIKRNLNQVETNDERFMLSFRTSKP